jgi:acetoin utilization deacetylase AcuC-like enzyme
MITVFDDMQRRHAPREFVVSGKPQPIPERPERIGMLLEGVRRMGGPIVAPPEILGDSLAGQCGYHLGDGSCPVTPDTWASARASAATAAHGATLLLDGEPLVYALCRPPGYHAAAGMAAGFCYFNNTAIAAEMLTRAGRRTAILDIDVHHGNGTEAIFYDRADVLVLAAGLDIAIDDPFKGFAIETAEFEIIGRLIAQLAMPLLVVREGGYPSPNLGANLASLLQGLGA